MKRQIVLLAGLCLALISQAQQDTTARPSPPAPGSDTIRVGNLIIVRNGKYGTVDSAGHRRNPANSAFLRRSTNQENVSTNWLVFDIGFASFNDRTNYASGPAQQFAPGANADWFDLRTIKSVDVNIWLFMQRVNLVKHVVNLKYGLGIELNNYRYTKDIRFLTDPTRVIMDTIHYSKNKLAVDYVTVPLMLNFNLTPGWKNEGLGFSAGVSFGYRYSSRQKFISSETGKKKTHDNFDLNPWKISYIGELQLGPIKLYGSYATQSMFKKGLDQIPYTVGIRFSNW